MTFGQYIDSLEERLIYIPNYLTLIDLENDFKVQFPGRYTVKFTVSDSNVLLINIKFQDIEDIVEWKLSYG